MESDDRWQTVESYREQLETCWGIRRFFSEDEIFAALSPGVREQFKQHRKLLPKNQVPALRRFYQWLAHEDRFGLVHSIKWSEILASGAWAAWAVERYAPQGTVLDLGANAGYWSSWMTSRRRDSVVGLEVVPEAVAYGRKITEQFGLPMTTRVGDFTSHSPDSPVSAAVSLQEISEYLRRGEAKAIRGIADLLGPGGHMVLVDETAANRAPAADKIIREAGLGIVACGLVGGFTPTGWASYAAIVAQKDGPTSATIDDVNHIVTGRDLVGVPELLRGRRRRHPDGRAAVGREEHRILPCGS